MTVCIHVCLHQVANMINTIQTSWDWLLTSVFWWEICIFSFQSKFSILRIFKQYKTITWFFVIFCLYFDFLKYESLDIKDFILAAVYFVHLMFLCLNLFEFKLHFFKGGGEIAQWLVSHCLCLSSRPSRLAPGMICLFQKGGILSGCYLLFPTSADDWFNKGRQYVIMW